MLNCWFLIFLGFFLALIIIFGSATTGTALVTLPYAALIPAVLTVIGGSIVGGLLVLGIAFLVTFIIVYLVLLMLSFKKEAFA